MLFKSTKKHPRSSSVIRSAGCSLYLSPPRACLYIYCSERERAGRSMFTFPISWRNAPWVMNSGVDVDLKGRIRDSTLISSSPSEVDVPYVDHMYCVQYIRYVRTLCMKNMEGKYHESISNINELYFSLISFVIVLLQ